MHRQNTTIGGIPKGPRAAPVRGQGGRRGQEMCKAGGGLPAFMIVRKENQKVATINAMRIPAFHRSLFLWVIIVTSRARNAIALDD